MPRQTDRSNREVYERSLKVKRDWRNSLDTSFFKGLEKGKLEGQKAKELEIAKEMRLNKESVEKIMKYTGLSKEEIESLTTD